MRDNIGNMLFIDTLRRHWVHWIIWLNDELISCLCNSLFESSAIILMRKKHAFFSGIVYSGVIVLHVTRSFYDYFSTTTQMTKFNCGSQTRGINGRKLILVFILLNKQHNAAFPICYDYASEKIIQTIYLPPTR